MSASDTVAVPAPPPTVHIRPPRRWGDLRLGEVWEYRELVYFLLKRELQIRYKQSILGVSWAVLQPIVLAGVFSLFFGVLAQIDAPGDTPYPVFALAGLVPWLFFSQAVALSAGSLVADQALLSKIYFPRLVIPMAKVIALLLDLAIAFVVLLIVLLLYGFGIRVEILLVPAFLGIGVTAAMGAGFLLSAINVKYRDVTVATPLILQIMLFISPIIYPSELVPGAWKYVYALNPMVGAIEGTRWALFAIPDPNLGVYAASLGSALVLVAVGIVYFRRTEQFFADVI